MERLNNINITKTEKSHEKVGIKFDGSQIEIMVPSTFRIEKDEKVVKKDLLLFLNSISIAKKIEYTGTSNSKEKGNCWPIDSFLWIIRDFLENGYYYSREKIYTYERNGKISWKKTLKGVPIISEGNVIYDKLVTSKMSYNEDIVVYTYKYCLKQSKEKVGWLFNCNFLVDIQPMFSLKEMKYVIKKELLSTYDDIKRLRFNHMLNILESIDEDSISNNKFNYVIENYYYVFEKMVDSLFQGIDHDELKKYNPSGYWQLNGKKPELASNLSPDTIYKTQNETYIIDAKMYQYGCTHDVNDLPQTSSMQKQITYGDYILNNVDPQTKVRNAFILPYNKKLTCFVQDKNIEIFNNGNLAYIGEALVDWRKDERSEDHERIFAFLIDFNYLLNNYKKKNDDIKILTEKIEKLLNSR